jgi:hypothetical protein
MELGFLQLADHAEVWNGKVYTMGAGWNNLRLAQLPTPMKFFVVFGLDVDWDETNSKHHLELWIEDPDGQMLAEQPFSLDFEVGRPPGVRPQAQRFCLSVQVGLDLQVNGPHAAVLTGDGEELGRSRFYVSAEANAE